MCCASRPSACQTLRWQPQVQTPAMMFKRPERKSRAGWVLLVLLMSIAAFGFLYKDWVLQEAELLKKYLLRGTPAAAAPEEAASAAAAAAIAAAASAASAEAMAAAELAASGRSTRGKPNRTSGF